MGSSYARTVVRTTLVGVVLAAVLGGSLATSVSAAPTAPAQQCGGNTSAAPTLTPSRTTIGQHDTATITVTGTNYLVPPHVCGASVFGGVYVAFGWVKPGGQWGPSWRSSTSAAGLFGRGPASHQTARAVDGSIVVEYERILRWSAPTKMKIRLAPIRGVPHPTETSIWMTRGYVEDLDLKRVSPEITAVRPPYSARMPKAGLIASPWSTSNAVISSPPSS